MPSPDSDLAESLRTALAANASAFDEPGAASRCHLLRQLVADGLATLPLPGSGATLERWRALGRVAAADLPLAKLYEGHTDAQAILQEAAAGDAAAREVLELSRGATFGTWAAEAPGARVTFRKGEPGRARLGGVKAWCSGAQGLDQAVLTVWADDGTGPFLAAVDLRQAGVSFVESHWAAVGMSATASVDVRFEQVPATVFAAPGFYLSRPGFWQGGAGIAACWHGGTLPLAQVLHERARQGGERAGWPLLLALGAVDRVLSANAALLREAAAWIDACSSANAQDWALRTRAAADDAARRVLDVATRALGAGPMCRDAAFARRVADLPVFVRQSHGDRDLAALGERLVAGEGVSWSL